jgi:flagellar biosynthesis/type III secretory pathway protein FliH
MAAAELAALVRSQGIIKAAQLQQIHSIEQWLAQAVAQAEAILQQAHLQAAKLQLEAQEAAERLAFAARERGYQQGLHQAKESLASTIAHNQSALAQSWQQQDEKLVHLVMQTLCTILTEEDPQQQFFASAARRVLRVARDRRFLMFKVAPAQLELARSSIERVLADSGAPNFVEVLSEPDLPLGACFVECEHTRIDASLATQLAALQRAVTAVFDRPSALETPVAPAVSQKSV